jgi:hypothetical protein
MLTSLPRKTVAATLQRLVAPLAEVNPDRHRWLPGGLREPEEAKLGECPHFLTPELREELTSWWLVNRNGANTPNWDILSTCTIEGREGLLLIEAKAHDTEARREGKSKGNAENDRQIGEAIAESNAELLKLSSGWAIQRDSHYQLSNRFAWAWKAASLGVPVILVYLGFLNADEMSHCGQPFTSSKQWRDLILDHGAGVIPESAWGTRLKTPKAPMWALLRSMDLKWTVEE